MIVHHYSLLVSLVNIRKTHMIWQLTFFMAALNTPTAMPAKINQKETLFLNLSQNSAFKLLPQEVDDQTTHHFLHLSQIESAILLVVIAFSFALGNIYRFLLLKQIWDENGFRKPINIMTGIIFALLTYPIYQPAQLC